LVSIPSYLVAHRRRQALGSRRGGQRRSPLPDWDRLRCITIKNRHQTCTFRYAFRAHEILYRPSQDLDFAIGDATPLPEIAEHVRQAFQSAGYVARLVEATSRYARLVLQCPGSGDELEMDLLNAIEWV
jgi:hypothetical protein